MTPIVHITDKEQALQRENANMLDTINKQSVSIEKLRKVVEMKDLTIEAQEEELKKHRELCLKHLVMFDEFQAEIAALKAQPVQEPVAWQYRTKPSWDANHPWTLWSDCSKANYEDYLKAIKRGGDWLYEVRALCAAPVQPVQPALTDAEFPELPRPDRNAWPNGFHDLFTAQQMRDYTQQATAPILAKLATQVALVEKCMVAMNENADRGEKAEAELTKLKAQPVQGSETSSATFRAMLFAFVRMSLVNPSEAQLHQLDRIIEFYGELKFASQLKLLAHQARTPHINRTAGRLVFSGQGVAAPVQPAPQPQFVQCRYGDSGYACCEGRSCEADEHNDADKGKKADAEVARLVRKLALEREELKAELAKLKAQPVQEPCAWMYQCTADKSGPSLQLRKQNWAESGSGLWIETPLYAAPVQPALTGEQTCQMCGYVGCDTDAVGECPRCHWDELVPTVGNGLRSALNAMLTQFGIDEDEWNKPTFDQARAALRTGGAG